MRLLLFDIDHTLLSVRSGLGRSICAEAFRSVYGSDPTDVLRSYSFSGRTDRRIVDDLGVMLGIDAAILDDGWNAYEDILRRRSFETITQDDVHVHPGVRDLLHALNDSGITLALVTGNQRDVARHKLAMGSLDDHFDMAGAFGCEHADRDLLPPLALERINARCLQEGRNPFDVTDTVVIGDAPPDIRCASVNGMRSLAVATGEFDVQALTDHGADAVLPDFSDTKLAIDLLLHI